jgi:hypothetical protein
MGALNLPSAADIERLTRRLRAVSHRLEGIEDGVDRLDRALTPSAVEARLASIEAQLEQLAEKVDRALSAGEPAPRGRAAAARGSLGGARTAATDKQVGAAKRAKAGHGARAGKAGKAAKAARTPGARSRANRPAPGKA